MLIVAGKFTFDPNKRDVAEVACAKIMSATQKEPANIEYTFSFDVTDPATIRVFEVWENETDLDSHLKLQHVDDFRIAMKAMGVSAAEVKKYDVSNARPMM